MVKSAPTDLDVADRVKKGEKRRLVMEIQPHSRTTAQCRPRREPIGLGDLRAIPAATPICQVGWCVRLECLSGWNGS